MTPFLTEQLATERRVRLRHEAERARLVRSAKRSSTARLRVRALEPTDVDRLADLYDGLPARSRILEVHVTDPEVVGLCPRAPREHRP